MYLNEEKVILINVFSLQHIPMFLARALNNISLTKCSLGSNIRLK